MDDARPQPDAGSQPGPAPPSKTAEGAPLATTPPRPWAGEGLPRLRAALLSSASAERARVNLERLAATMPDPAAFYQTLESEPRLRELLVTLFAGSQFLSEILLAQPDYLARLREFRRLAQGASDLGFDARVRAALAPCSTPEEQLAALRRLQRWELLRIGVCDLLGLADLATVTRQLSELAESIVRAALDLAAAQAASPTDGFAVLALGKLGGGELNYSSDIDLLFLAQAQAGAYQGLAERLIDALARVTAEGFLYRVDMRLRPWGAAGSLVTTPDAYLAYLRQHARLWEKQALLKARPIAGARALGDEFLRQAAPFLCVDREAARRDVRGMKARIEAELSRRGRDWGEVKLGKGSIRDVEFATQYLQLVHGGAHAGVLVSNTLEALARLQAAGLLPAEEQRALAEGYVFLRPVEHYLQMMQHHQTHTLPTDPQELAYLARRLGFEGEDAGRQFLARYEEHCAAIRAVYQRHLEGGEVNETPATPARQPAPDVRRHVERMAPSYAATFHEHEIAQHAALAGTLDAENPVRVEAAPLGAGRWRVTIVGYDYPGELSLICGLLFAHGLSIQDGHVFTYEPVAARPRERPAPDARRKIVDVFTVHSARPDPPADLWASYARELAALLRRLEAGEGRQVHADLAKRIAEALPGLGAPTATLHPIDIEIDNDSSDRYTVLRIDSPDTIGFLYEFTSALALNGIYIAQVTVTSVGSRAHDTLYLTDARGRKIVDPTRQQELRAATVLVKHLTHLLPQSPNPESALLHFHEFLGELFRRPDWPQELASLERPEVLGALARLLGVSDFLWDDFLRMQHANLFPVVRDPDALSAAVPKAQLRSRLASALAAARGGEARRAALNAFKDREMFRIDMRHILGYSGGFAQFSAELTDLAEVVVGAAYDLCLGELRAEHGVPLLEDGRPCASCICALGKCGGRELGFASDIELIFIFAGNGRTRGPRVITSAEFHEKAVVALTQAIRTRREGIFEIDLRLRPYGQAGSMAVSLESFRRYFAPGGPAWEYERQALIKLRPIAGDLALAQQVAQLRDEFVYGGSPLDLVALRGMRERQIRHLVAGGTINAKFSPGGLVDLEYLVQGLQVMHGPRDPSLRLTNTREAIAALAAAGIISRDDYARLREAHIFLRQLIDALRMVRGNARDLTVPPAQSEEFWFLARRLGYGDDPARLQEDLLRQTASVQELARRLLG